MTPIAPVWRSLLFVPAHVGTFVETAHRRDADANAAAMAEGRGAFAFDGAMVDLPVLRRAEETLRRHAAVQSATRPLPRGETP